MDTTLWISFIGTVLVLVFTPGPSVLLATANSMNHGLAKTTGTILGDLSANLLQIVLASAGLATIVVSSGELFQAIKWCGVAYLIYIGLRKIFSSEKIELQAKNSKPRGFWSLYGEGFLMSAANPKAIVFFAAFFPLFINQSLPFLPQVVVLAISFLVLDGISLLIYALFATRLRSYLENSRKVGLQNKIIGSLLVLSGLMLSLIKRGSNG